MGSLNRTTFGNNSSLPSLTGSGDTGSKAFASPTWDAQLCWPKRFMLWVLRQGVIPRHFAIVPDGNRRFAKTNGLKLSHAYSIMLRKLTLICHCMATLGVAEVTAYLLSPRNFSRNTTDIVTALQDSAKFFMQTLHSLSILRRISLRASVVGNMNLLPQDMQTNIAHVDIATDHGSRATTLRLCIPYSSKLDLNNMVLELANAVRVGVIKPDDISPGLIADWLELIETPETELWFRSSGERRFSEFLVLQSGYSYMHIEPELWPAMTIWNWVLAILRFQLYWPHIEVGCNISCTTLARAPHCNTVSREMDSRCTTHCGSQSGPHSVTSGVSTSIQGFTRLTWNVQKAWYQRIVIWVLRQGATPRHVSIAPDGNRRYAKSSGIGLGSAYVIMFQKIALLSQYMMAVGVKDITSALFSTRNFARDTSEVNAVLSAAAKFCKTTLRNLDLLQRMNLSVRVVGDVDLLPKQLQSNMAQVEIASSNGSRKHTCNLCTAYSSKLYMKSTVLHIANAVRAGVIKSDDVTAELIWDSFALTEACETDLWFRSSGRQCLLEFLVLQSGYAFIHIVPQLCFSVGFWDFVLTILQFQLHWPYIKVGLTFLCSGQAVGPYNSYEEHGSVPFIVGLTRMTSNIQLAWYQRIVIWVLRQGVVPRHAAIAPDGNRRYAKSTGIGLGSAYVIMIQKIALLSQCMVAVGVEQITYGVFSTRNFVRDTSEINAVFSAMVQFCKTTLCSLDLLQRMNLRVRVVGDVDLLPKQLQSNMAQVEIATANGIRKHTCNFCTAYSSNLDMKSTVLHIANAVRAGVIKSDDITAELIWDLFSLTEASETDLWYRSSGRQCLIELLVLQSGYSYMHIEPQLWPSVGFWEFLWAILQFQLHWPYIKAVKESHQKLYGSSSEEDPATMIRQRMFLRSIKLWRMKYIGKFCSS